MFLYARLCPPSDPLTPPAFSWHWWYVVMAIAGAVSMAVLMVVYVAKLRRKETRFGCVGSFAPRGWKGGTVLLFQTKVYLFLVPWPSCYMYEGILEQRKKIKTHQLSHSLCVVIHFCIDREAFEPMMESGELVVRYRARRTYSRRTTEATCEFTALPPPPDLFRTTVFQIFVPGCPCSGGRCASLHAPTCLCLGR